jgi:hypothetical protein
VDAAAAATSYVVVSSSTSISDAMGRVGSGGRGRVREGGERAGGRGGECLTGRWLIAFVPPRHPPSPGGDSSGAWPLAGGGRRRRTRGKTRVGANGVGDVGFCVSAPRFFSFQSLGLSDWRDLDVRNGQEERQKEKTFFIP